MNKQNFDRISILFQPLHRKDEYIGNGMVLLLAEKLTIYKKPKPFIYFIYISISH